MQGPKRSVGTHGISVSIRFDLQDHKKFSIELKTRSKAENILDRLTDGPFDIQEGGWDFFLKSFFPNRSEKKKISYEVKNKKFVLHSVNFIETLFPGSYKD